MGRGRSIYLTYTALVLLGAASVATADDIWAVHIDESPAPPPGKGPPFSAHASRNPNLIPYQVVGIVGAYIGTVLILGSLLLTVGRSLRKKAQNTAMEPTEMVKPSSRTFERSPTSPGSSRHWYSPKRLKEKKSVSSSIRSGASDQISPGMNSVASFDTNVLEADKRRRRVEMERLYAAVMTHDEARNPEEQPVGTAVTTDMPPEYSRKKPPRLVTNDPNLRYLQAPGNGEITPKSPVRAIYPPDSDLPLGPSSPTSPIRAEYPPWASQSQLQPESRHIRELSTGSAKTTGSDIAPRRTTSPKKIRKSIRNIKISGPIMRDDDHSDNDRTPLSPRYYTDPGTPPEPPVSATNRSAGYPATPPGNDYEDIDHVRDLPQANPQRLSAHVYANQPQIVTDISSSHRPNPIQTRTNALPLREYNRQHAQQSQNARAAAFPLSPGHWNATNTTSPGRAYATSAGPVKTTFLEARRDKISGPKTGLPTPYSPYMPFTPLTPVPAHLTSKAERKQKAREEKRWQRPILEEDKVVDEKDLWSSGY